MNLFIQSDGHCSFAYNGEHKSFHATKEGDACRMAQLRHNIEWRKSMVAMHDDPTTKCWYGSPIPELEVELSELDSKI